MRTVSEANQRGSHWAKTKRMAEHRAVAKMACQAARRKLTVLTMEGRRLIEPLIVTLIRIGPRILDTDNCAGAMKGVRDGVAAALGIDDADPNVKWRYAQQKRTRAAGGYLPPYAVIIEIEARP